MCLHNIGPIKLLRSSFHCTFVQQAAPDLWANRNLRMKSAAAATTAATVSCVDHLRFDSQRRLKKKHSSCSEQPLNPADLSSACGPLRAASSTSKRSRLPVTLRRWVCSFRPRFAATVHPQQPEGLTLAHEQKKNRHSSSTSCAVQLIHSFYITFPILKTSSSRIYKYIYIYQSYTDTKMIQAVKCQF